MIENKVVFTILITVIVLSSMFGVVLLIRNVENSYEERFKLNCADYFIDDLHDLPNYYALCENDECRNYFKERINQTLENIGVCLE